MQPRNEIDKKAEDEDTPLLSTTELLSSEY